MFDRIKDFVIKYNIQITIVSVLIPLLIQFKIFIYPLIVDSFNKIPSYEKVYDYAVGFRNPFKQEKVNHNKLFINSLTDHYKDNYPGFAISDLKASIKTLVSLEKRAINSEERMKISLAIGEIEKNNLTPSIDILTKHLSTIHNQLERSHISAIIANLLFLVDTNQAIEMYKQSLIYDRYNLFSINALGNVYSYLKEYDEASFYFNNLASIATQKQDWNSLAKAKSNLGTTYQLNKNYSLAIKMYSEAIAINVKIGKIQETATQYYNMGQIAEIKNDIDNACLYYRKSRMIFYQHYQDKMVTLLDRKMIKHKCH